MSNDWRIETDAEDYFSHQNKKLQVADRRPVIRRASDLVGPGINADATRILDFNDELATFNGFYAAVPGALNAPNAEDEFIGTTVMDASIGGVQSFLSMEDGEAYKRRFFRNPSDPATIFWGDWVEEGGSAVPVGTVISFAGAIIPEDWLVCNGGSFAPMTYPKLFEALGSSTLPDLRDRAVYGVGSSWTLGGDDGLDPSSREKILHHNHGVLVSGAEHTHTVTGESNGWVAPSGSGATISIYGHTHTLSSTGPMTSSGGTWSGDYMSKPPALRGYGLNMLIKAA